MKKILIADDDEDIRGITRNMLEGDGYQVLEASNGQEALDRTIRDRPDLVLLDLMMPEIHGYSVCRQIKGNDSLKDTKVVMFSVKSYPADRRQAQEVGADDFITKPADMQSLRERIRTNLCA